MAYNTFYIKGSGNLTIFKRLIISLLFCFYSYIHYFVFISLKLDKTLNLTCNFLKQKYSNTATYMLRRKLARTRISLAAAFLYQDIGS